MEFGRFGPEQWLFRSIYSDYRVNSILRGQGFVYYRINKIVAEKCRGKGFGCWGLNEMGVEGARGSGLICVCVRGSA